MQQEPSAALPLVAMHDVSKFYDNGRQALDRLNLTINTGEFLSLLGPSGCGKSTALRLLAGLARPTSGTIIWRGQSVPSMGFVFQEPTLMPWASVARNVWLPLRLQGTAWKEAESRVMAMLERVGLGNFRTAYPRELSGGMKMRVSIARALITQPALLLLDEPFSALDEITRFRLNDDLLALSSTLGTTVVFVTHSVYESVYLSQRIALFSSSPGRIVHTMTIGKPAARAGNFRLTPEYARHCLQVSAVLEGAGAPVSGNDGADRCP